MIYLSNFGEFEQSFTILMDGEYDMEDIHKYYIFYKENPVFEDVEEFIKDFFQQYLAYRNTLWLKK